MKDINNKVKRMIEYITARKGYCLMAVILMVFFAVFLSGVKIETVSRHNEKESEAAEERKSLLAQIEETTVQETENFMGTGWPEETGGKETESSSVKEADIPEDIQQSSLANPSAENVTNEEVQQESRAKTDNQQSAVQESVSNQQPSEEPSSNQQPATQPATTQSSTTQPVTQSPILPSSEKPSQREFITVSIRISCEKILNNPDLNTTAQIPSDGIFLDTKTVVKKGETVFDALKAACSDNGISYVNNGSSYGAYISSIAGLSEKQCGKYSGWKYKVNNVVPNVTCSQYELSENDEILWYYAATYTD